MSLLDKLKQLEIIPDAYESWSEYRKNVTDFILNQTENFDNIALFGAGRCNDIDLARLVASFKQVVLLDQDAVAMADALRQYGLVDHPNVLCIQQELVGIPETKYLEYIQRIEAALMSEGKCVNTSEINHLLEEVKETIRNTPLDLGEKNYKNSVAMGLHSQLNIYWAHIWGLYSEAFNYQEPLFYEKIKIMNTLAVKKLNQALLKGTVHHLYIGYETQRMERPGRVEGAIQAENDLEQQEALGYLVINSEREAVWPLKPGCTYEMRLLCITPSAE